MKQKLLFCLLGLYMGLLAPAQPYPFTTAYAHSHNDYVNPMPFWTAYHQGFGSIEADVHLFQDSLLVAHEHIEPGLHRTLEQLYLQPLQECVRKNNGYPYADHARQLQLLIDVKTDPLPTLNKIIQVLNGFPQLTASPQIRFVITGGRPDPEQFNTYPPFIWFDGNAGQSYSSAALSRIALFSAGFYDYSSWNGKGSLTAADVAKLQPLVNEIHRLGKPVRFWATPDTVNAWYQLMKLKVDYLNTDHITSLAYFLGHLQQNAYRNDRPYALYQPSYASDGQPGKVKNVILLIGDGTGLAQLYAGYTANHGQLNIFNMHSIGLSKTSSHDAFITDSAPGSTAISSGVKTNNRFVGVDHTGKALPLIPFYLSKKNIATGLVTCGEVTDATPADFYAHRSERDSAAAIFHDLASAPVRLLMGSGNKSFTPALRAELEAAHFNIRSSVDSVPAITPGKWLVLQPAAALSIRNGRGDWLRQAFRKTAGILKANKNGFFLMTEGAQVDHGGHANNLPYVATEVMDFDQVVGEALRFADTDGGTLVIVTADHETGGLSLLDGNYASGYISGSFATGDHTALPVPVFAYGPGSQLFRGVYENTELFHKILQAFGVPEN